MINAKNDLKGDNSQVATAHAALINAIDNKPGNLVAITEAMSVSIRMLSLTILVLTTQQVAIPE